MQSEAVTRIRRSKTQLLALLLLMALPVMGHAQLIFTTNNGAITITGFTGSGTEVDIPGMTNGWPVTSIGLEAFMNNTIITSVVIPTSVTNIGSLAFGYCTNLTSVPLPNTLTSIGSSAFYLCRHLTSVVIPDSVTGLGAGAFELCYSLTNVVIGSNIASVPDGTFEECSNLSSITISDAVTNIGNQAFLDCNVATNLFLGSNVTSIGSQAFSHCFRLTSVSIPNSVISIGGGAFEYCYDLTNLTIGSNASSIGGGFVDFCGRLPAINVETNNITYKSVDGILFNFSQTFLIRYPEAKAGSYIIPDNVTNTGYEAFRSCSSLVNVTTGNGLVGMGGFAFAACGNLTNVTISGGLTNAGIIDFPDLFGLTSITVDTNNPAYMSLNGVLFDRSKTTLIVYPGGRTDSSYTIPAGVTLIQSSAFSQCFSLATLIVPATVTNIASSAFFGCPNLTGVYFEGKAPTANSTGLSTLYFQFGVLKVYYLPGTIGWSSSFDGAPTTSWTLPYPLILNNGPGFGIQSNQFGFTVSWATNRSVAVDGSTNLTFWQPLATNAITGGSFYFSDTNWTSYQNRFYRIRSL